jgi:DNA-binding transcriptional MerR regulator
MLTIGQLADEAGVGVETIRFYERAGLLAEPGRLASGYRQYPPAAVERVKFLRRAQRLGFTLKEAKELLDLRGIRVPARRTSARGRPGSWPTSTPGSPNFRRCGPNCTGSSGPVAAAGRRPGARS